MTGYEFEQHPLKNAVFVVMKFLKPFLICLDLIFKKNNKLDYQSKFLDLADVILRLARQGRQKCCIHLYSLSRSSSRQRQLIAPASSFGGFFKRPYLLNVTKQY